MALFLYGACATAYALLAALLFVQSRRSRTGRRLLACCAITALWAAAWAVSGAVAGAAPGAATPGDVGVRGLADGLDLLRAACWYGFILHLYRRSVPGGGQAGTAFRTMGLVALLVTAVAFVLSSACVWGVFLLVRRGVRMRPPR